MSKASNVAKQVAGAVFMKGALSGRNLTSLALVAFFFGVYVASGGKISSIPRLDNNAQFGGVLQEDVTVRGDVLEVQPQGEDLFRAPRERVRNIEPLPEESAEPEAIENSGKPSSTSARDRLAEIEERLNAARGGAQ